MRQSACLVMNPIAVDSFAFLFNCKPVGRASDSMHKISRLGWTQSCLLLGIRGNFIAGRP